MERVGESDDGNLWKNSLAVIGFYRQSFRREVEW